jgi:F-type H+-transporting ATPase subunit delta
MTSTGSDWGVAAQRTATLDAALDGLAVSAQLSDELFAVVDLLAAHPALARALTDPGSEVEARRGLISRLLDGQVGEAALQVVDAAIAIRWPTPGGLSTGLERQAVRAVLLTAAGEGEADQVEEELFRLRQTVLGDLKLSAAIEDRERAASDRRELVSRLLADKAVAQTRILAERAVPTRGRARYEETLADYLELSAAMHGGGLAVVVTARGLSAGQRTEMIGQLERITGHPVDLREIVDPEVLGGARITLSDEVIDGTIARRLDQARQTLG